MSGRRAGACARTLLLTVLASGCAGVTATRDLNAEFAAAYEHSLGLEQALAARYDPATQAALDQARSQLGAIADRALAAARAAGDDADKAAYYALTARAAWKSGPVKESSILEMLAEGRDLCAGLRDSGLQPARDCAFIAIAAPLALADAYASGTTHIAAHEHDGRFPSADLDAMRAAFGGLEQQFRALDAARSAVFAAPVSAEFRAYFVEQQFRIYCNAQTLRSWMLDLDDDSGDEVSNDLAAAEQQMRTVLSDPAYAIVHVTVGGQEKIKSCG
jgi:hypothetical protein